MKQYSIIEFNEKKGNDTEIPSVQKIVVVLSNISRLLDRKLLIRLKEVEESIPSCSNRGFIPISNIYEKICKNFSISKKEARKVLSELRRREYIEFVRFKGIKLKYTLEK